MCSSLLAVTGIKTALSDKATTALRGIWFAGLSGKARQPKITTLTLSHDVDVSISVLAQILSFGRVSGTRLVFCFP